MAVAAYVRVSTDDQSLDRQLRKIADYAQGRLGKGLSDLDVYRDKSTGKDTNRSGYRDLMTAIQSDNVEVVVTGSVSRVSRSIRDLDRTVERVVRDAETPMHFVSEGLVVRPDDEDPFQRAMLRLLGVFAELEADLARARTREGLAARMEDDEYHHGPAPLGFEKDAGRLIPGEDYDQVVSVLEMVGKGELSKRKAARELGCGRATVSRALDRGGIYGL